MSHRSESDGEIVESESEKATSVQHSTRDSSVDLQNRPRTSLSRSPRPLAQLDGPSDANPRHGLSRDDARRSNHRLARDTHLQRPQSNKRHHDDDYRYTDGHGQDGERDRHNPSARHSQNSYDRSDRLRYDDRGPANDSPRHVNRAPGTDYARPDAHVSGTSQSRHDDGGPSNNSRYYNPYRGNQEERDGSKRHGERTENYRYRDSGSRRSNTRRGSQEEREPPEKRARYHGRRDSDVSADSQRFHTQSFVPAEREERGGHGATASDHASIEQQKRPRILEKGELTNQQKHAVEVANAAKAAKAARDLAEEQPPVEPVDEDKVIEERRKRREAIRAKHRGTLLQQALHQNTALNTTSTTTSTESSLPATPADDSVVSSAASSPAASQPDSPQPVPAFSVTTDEELANPGQATSDLHDPAEEAAAAAAADYDPSHDMQESKIRQRLGTEGVAEHAETDKAGLTDVVAPTTAPVEPQTNNEFDMFGDDDVDDMFAMEPAAGLKKADGTQAVRIPKAKQLDKSMLDDWDDHEGYYRIILGELLDGRYHIQTNLGKGVFSAVVRAMDAKTETVVAIKIIRTQESMYRAGMKEIETLQKIAEADPEDKRHIIRLIRHFEHKGHLCMVFENLSINLREVLKKFGRDIGINIKAVRSYAQQMFLGLSLLQKCEILHADLKPDNVLVNEARSQLKIADLGSAISADDNEVTDALVSRFYRAPEIMLGIKHDYAIDMWSIGCTLFELYTGKILFTGPTNNQMLKAIIECRGKVPNRMLKKSEFWAQHFAPDGTFLSQEVDNITRREVVRRINITKTTPAKELKTRLLNSSKDLSVAEAKELNLFADLLDKCLAVDPARRITPAEALKHGFIQRNLFVGK